MGLPEAIPQVRGLKSIITSKDMQVIYLLPEAIPQVRGLKSSSKKTIPG